MRNREEWSGHQVDDRVDVKILGTVDRVDGEWSQIMLMPGIMSRVQGANPIMFALNAGHVRPQHESHATTTNDKGVRGHPKVWMMLATSNLVSV